MTVFGAMGMAEGQTATEDEEPDPRSPGLMRSQTEAAVRAWADRNVRTCVVRLSPSVHGDGDHGLIPRLIAIARKQKSPGCIGGGENRWSAIHHLDAAVLLRLALEKDGAGWLAPFAAYDNPAPSQWTQDRLGWRPTHSSLLADLDHEVYFRA